MQNSITRAVSVVPSPRQLAWQKTEFYAFIHFTVNTFTGREWGDGTEDPVLFNPTPLRGGKWGIDTAQWVRVIQDAGMKGLILTAKHHDGFCLWQSRYTGHSVKNSPWKNGQGDVVREAADACRAAGLKFGIYLSPWDRHEPCYGDSPAYNAYFKNQLTELLTGYGELFCVWFDGACGEGPNGKRQVYDWDGYYALVRQHQPGAVISVCGPDVRWCGNEAGHCRSSEWSVVPIELRDAEKIAEKSQQADSREFALHINSSDEDLGSLEKISRARNLAWYPAEVNTSIRSGWFYHSEEDDQVKSLRQLLDIYYGSVGGNTCFLLNFPPDRRGLIHENDAARAHELGEVLRQTFATNLALGASVTATSTRAGGFSPASLVDGSPDTYWTTEEGQESAMLEVTLPEPKTFNVAMLQEHIETGQRIESFHLSVLSGGEWQTIASSTVVGYKRLLRFAPVTAQKVRIEIIKSRLSPALSAFGLYTHPDLGPNL